MSVTNAGDAYGGGVSNYIASSVTSLGKSSDISAPGLPSISSGALNVSYSTTGLLGGTKTVTLPGLNFDGMSVLSATDASSSAAAFTDSLGSLNYNSVISAIPDIILSPAVNAFKELATPVKVSISGNTSTASNLPGSAPVVAASTPQDLVNNPILRLADGAYTDNTGVTSGLTYLQANHQLKNGFTICAIDTFVPSANPPDAGLAAINIGYNNLDQGARNLFTGGSQYQTEGGNSAYNSISLSHPSTAVFDSAKTTGLSAPVWQYTNSTDNFSIALYQLGVTTTANNLNIPTGLQGTLDVWEIYAPTATAALPTQFSQYEQLYNDIVSALQTTNNGHVGAALLAQTLAFA